MATLPVALSALALCTLSGCGPSRDAQFAPSCPRAVILADAADITRFRPGSAGHDLTDMVLDGRITGIAGQCARGDDDALQTRLKVGIELARGPAARTKSDTVPLFVAVTRDKQLLDKQVYQVAAQFPPNTDRLRLTSDDVTLTLPPNSAGSGARYDIFVGFQITPDELALNRQRGPR
jgi:hypothetical protein